MKYKKRNADLINESSMTVLAVSSDRLPMTSVLLHIRQKPFNRHLIIVVLLTLNNDLRERRINNEKA